MEDVLVIVKKDLYKMEINVNVILVKVMINLVDIVFVIRKMDLFKIH